MAHRGRPSLDGRRSYRQVTAGRRAPEAIEGRAEGPRMNMRTFAGNRVVITGGGSGLGRALSLRFARERWRVAIADINLERAEETLAQVRTTGGDGFVERCDVARDQDFETLAARVEKEWG